MHIEIAERLRPYSHLPGTHFILPGSSLRVQVFPALVKIDDLSGPVSEPLAILHLAVKGPIEGFTVQQDLERGEVLVWGKSQQGFLRYTLKAVEGGFGIVCNVEKAPLDGITFKSTGKWQLHGNASVVAGQQIVIGPSGAEAANLFKVPVLERLSLGNHKAQDWELMQRRLCFSEIFPLWHRLGQLIPNGVIEKAVGTAVLLEDCQRVIAANAPEKILAQFRNLFLAGFDLGLSPRLIDAEHQGIVPEIADQANLKGSPLALLSAGYKLICSLFVQEKAAVIDLLPALPPEFHCGRLLGARCGNKGVLHIEWTKKALRRVVFCAEQSQSLKFTFSHDQKSCRIRTSFKDPGLSYVGGTAFDVQAGQSYWLDNFQK